MRPFRIVRGKHVAFPGSEQSGCASVSVDEQITDVVSSLWPFPFDYVVDGVAFEGLLEPHVHPLHGPQNKGKLIKCVDSEYALGVTVLHSALSSALRKRLVVLLNRFGPSLFLKLKAVNNSTSAPDEMVGGRPLVTLTHIKEIAEAYESNEGVINISATFPPIDTELAMKYIPKVKVDDIFHDPYVLYWSKPDARLEKNPLHLADDIARHHLGEPLESMDLRRLHAYFNAAVNKLQHEGDAGSMWFTAPAICDEMLSLQGRATWGFSAEALANIFRLRPLPTFITEDEGLYARTSDAQLEQKLASRLWSIQSTNHKVSALNILNLIENVATKTAVDVSTAELDDLCPRWKSLLASYEKCDAVQRQTARRLVEHRIVVLLGGAGTGKSTTLAFLIRFAHIVLGVKMNACALTGKAVDRLRQLFSEPDDQDIICRTLHSQVANAEFDPAEALAT